MSNRDTWCVLPWTHVCVRTNGNIKPCCRWQNEPDEIPINIDSLYTNGELIFENPYLTQLRQDMLDGVERSGCAKCNFQEKSESHSSRILFNKLLSSNVSRGECDTTSFHSIRYIEMPLDNLCNLQCRMCDSVSSTKLQMVDKFLGKPVFKKLTPAYTKFDNCDLSNLAFVKILGGEPFISPNLIPFLEYISSKSDPSGISLEFATNGTVLIEDELISILRQFKSIRLIFSLDGYHSSNDYQRHGSNHKQIFNNANLMKDVLPNCRVEFHMVATIYTADSLGDTINFLSDNNYITSFDFALYPEYLNVSIAPKYYLDWVLDKNKSNDKAYNYMLNKCRLAKHNPELWAKFIEYTLKLDSYHNVNLKDYHPELHKLLYDNGDI